MTDSGSALGFDPRAARVVCTFEQHSPPPQERLTAAGLRARFSASTKVQWQTEPRACEPSSSTETVAAAVLIAFLQTRHCHANNSTLSLLLTQRPQSMSSHAGQIAFPGGRVDAEDASTEAAALREAWEEVALPPDAVQVLGRLPMYATGSGFAVHPIVALVDAGVMLADLRANPAEVDAVFAVSLSDLMQPCGHQLMQFDWQGKTREWFAMPTSDTQGEERYVWGVTAGIVRNLYHFLSA